MVSNELWISGVSNKDVGVKLQGEFVVSAPVPVVDTVKVPGRNGDLHIYTGAYENRTGKIDAYVFNKDNVKGVFGAVQNCLLGNLGYQRIVDGDDLEHYWLGRVVNGAEVAARINRIAPFSLKFDLKPQHFLTLGDDPVFLTENGAIYNPTNFASKPIYSVKGSGDVTVTVNGEKMEFTGLGEYIYADTITFDSESGVAYTPDASDTTPNSRISATGNYSLAVGKNTIDITGNVEYVKIIPRWWEL